ncbi:MAG: DUF4097 family beta strand repeat protein [Cyclobacteriaceae bacterium]
MTKFYTVLALYLLYSFSTLAQNNNYSFVEEFKVNSPAILKITTNDGNIQVEPGNSDEMIVHYIVKQRGGVLSISKSELEEEITFVTVRTGNSLSIKVRHKDRNFWRNSKDVSFKIYTPRQTSSELNTSDGNIHIERLAGNQILKTSDGNIHTREIDGNISARTSDGNIDMGDVGGSSHVVTSDGNIDLRTVGGPVTGRTSDGNASIKNVNGSVTMVTSDGNIQSSNIDGDLELTTSDGSIAINNVAGRCKLKTSDGNIRFENTSGSMSAVTSDGDIRGTMNNLNGKLYMRTNDGTIDVVVPSGLGLDLDLRADRIVTKLEKFNGTSEKKSILGSINGGGIPIDLRASDGTVVLAYK